MGLIEPFFSSTGTKAGGREGVGVEIIEIACYGLLARHLDLVLLRAHGDLTRFYSWEELSPHGEIREGTKYDCDEWTDWIVVVDVVRWFFRLVYKWSSLPPSPSSLPKFIIAEFRDLGLSDCSQPRRGRTEHMIEIDG